MPPEQIGNSMLRYFLIAVLTYSTSIHAVQDRWENTEYVWNYGIIQNCDVGMNIGPFQFFSADPVFNERVYSHISEGDIVWLKCHFLKRFYEEVFPHIKNPFVLVICDGDESFPSESALQGKINKLINSKKVKHIFAQNCDYTGPSDKVSHIPIGLDYHSIAYKSSKGACGEHMSSPRRQEAQLKDLLQNLMPTSHRLKRAFVDFQHNDSAKGPLRRDRQFGETRRTIFKRLKKTNLIDYSEKRMPRSELWRTKGEYAFSISPYGNGLDCHRTWEDLILGCIVIVKSTPLDPLYDGLPVVIVQDWSEVTEENMDRWLEEYGDAFTNPAYREKLKTDFWVKKVRNAANI